MKALITAGGRATRLRPITWTLNKHLIPLANKPMIEYAIDKLADVNVREIGIIVSEGDKDLERALGDGSRFGVKITYIEQIGGALGIAHAVNIAQPFLGDEPFIFYLGDNIILGSLKRFVDKFESEKLNCLLALAAVKDPRAFGVPEIVDGRIVRVDEKPLQPKSNYAVTGIYIYDKNFFEAFKHITPSARKEYEISDVHTWLIEKKHAVGYEEITGWWKDTGRPDDMLEGNALILNEMLASEMKCDGEVQEGARIQGKVRIGKGTKIGARVLIRGPVVIGENCELSDCYIGPYTSLGNNVKISGAEIEHSLILDGTVVRAAKRIVDSLIGRNSTICRVEETLPFGHRLVVGDNGVVEL
ncbi:MAG: glucose-1-phosphate thymidylyltransferase [bacterium]